MNVAVKVQNMASANTAGRLKSLEQSVKNGDFTKMLQAKKDLADVAEQAGNKQPEKTDGETAEKPSAEKAEDPKTPVKGDEDAGQQEALQQAALQQAAAQAAGMMAQEAEAALEWAFNEACSLSHMDHQGLFTSLCLPIAVISSSVPAPLLFLCVCFPALNNHCMKITDYWQCSIYPDT